MKYECRIPTLEEMNTKWDYEIEHAEDKYNWVIWKEKFINRFINKELISYYGFLGDKIICEVSAGISPTIPQKPEKLVDDKTAYLFAFRTIPEYQGQGYFSKLFKYMISDLKKRGYTKVTLGVEPTEYKNEAIYKKYGFTNFIRQDTELYPDGTEIIVDYYYKNI